jgi:predicted dienelactone hydrolase
MTNQLRAAALVLCLAACADSSPAGPDAVAPEVDAITPGADAATGLVPTAACAADPAACLYLPAPLPLEPVFTTTVVDPDRPGGPRDIPIAIRYSLSAPRPMPVVIWSHGGASGHLNPETSMDQWAITAAEAGYLSVAIAHVPRDQASRLALCTSLGIDATACQTFKFLGYDRPHDISFVIDRVIELAAQDPWTDRIDATRIAVGGHSAGAGGALMVAGALRDIDGVPTAYSDPRPQAFLAFSPQAPGSDGMTETGYAAVVRPTLIGTGRGDHNPPDTADGRASVFDLIQPGDKARLFIEDADANHMLFELETASCVTPTVPLAECEAMRDWIASAGLAFLDAHLRGSAAARAWLASSNVAVASAGVAEWSTR